MPSSPATCLPGIQFTKSVGGSISQQTTSFGQQGPAIQLPLGHAMPMDAISQRRSPSTNVLCCPPIHPSCCRPSPGWPPYDDTVIIPAKEELVLLDGWVGLRTVTYHPTNHEQDDARDNGSTDGDAP